MTAPVRCTRCGKDRYPRGVYASPYVCTRCLAAGAIKAIIAPRPAAPVSGDPFGNDRARREAINAASGRASRTWLERRPGWLRRG